MQKVSKIIFNNNTFVLNSATRQYTPVFSHGVLTYTAKGSCNVTVSAAESLKGNLFLNGEQLVFTDINTINVLLNKNDELTSTVEMEVCAFYES